MSYPFSKSTRYGSIDQPMNSFAKLHEVWNQENIDEGYQTVFEQYISLLPKHLIQIEVEHEIRLIKTKKSFYWTMAFLNECRRSVLKQLDTQLAKLNNQEHKKQKNIADVCKKIHQLRQANLRYAETLLSIHNYFKSKISEQYSFSKLVPFFEALQNDNQFLRKSLMRKYIVFSQSYDPFFLKHYELLKNTNNHRLKQLPAIEQLFTLPISDVYRLTKAEQQIKDYLKLNQSSEKRYLQRYRYREISPILSERIIEKNKKKQKKLKNNIYLFSDNQSISPQKRRASLTPLKTSISSPRKYQNDSQNKKIALPPINTMLTSYTQGSSSYLPKQVIKQHNTPIPRERSLQQNNKGYFGNKLTLIEQHERQFWSSLTPKHLKWKNKAKKNFFEKVLRIMNKNQMGQKIYVSNAAISLEITKEYQKILRKQRDNKKNTQQSPNKQQFKQILKKINNRQIDSKIQISKIVLKIENKQKLRLTKKIQDPKFKPQSKVEKLPIKQQQKIIKKQKREKINQQKNNDSPIQKGQKVINYTIKAGQPPDVLLSNFIDYFSKFQINQNYKDNICGNLQVLINHNQYYFHKFFINNEIKAISLCCSLPSGDILIKFWGPLVNCNQQMSQILFLKYIEHLEKNTLLRKINYNAKAIKQLAVNYFIKEKQRIYTRARIQSPIIQTNSYSPFLSINFTIIAISKQTPKQNELIIQNKIKEFQFNNFYVFNYLLIINKLMHPGAFSTVASYHPRLKSIQMAKEKIQGQYLSNDAYNSKFNCNQSNLLAVKLRNVKYSAYFKADKGYFKFVGQIVYEDPNCIIICLRMLMFNTKMYFGNGVKSAQHMIQLVKKYSKEKYEKVIDFSIRMFKKQLRGRLNCINLKNENCYGDFEIIFEWKDFLKGKIEHPMTNVEEIFDDRFYCLLEMEKQMMFTFEVQPEDFIK